MLELPDEQAECQVIDLASPEPRHTTKIQVLDTNRIVPPAQFMTRLPLPILAAIVDAL